MRSRFIKIDPVVLSAAFTSNPRLTMEARGFYVSLLLEAYCDCTRANINQRRRWGDPRVANRLLACLVECGLVEIDAAGFITCAHYSPTAWVRQSFPAAIRAYVFARDGEFCRECGATENLSIDHIDPVANDGPETLANYQVLCRPCNSRKGARA